MKTIQEMIEDIKRKRVEEAKHFEELDVKLCMLCHAYGADKRSLFIDCFYDIQEIVPEALDITDVKEPPRGGYYLRICKNCRGNLLGRLGMWRDERIARRNLPKDHDGDQLDEDIDPNKNIPVRINGTIVMMDEEGFKYYKESQT